MAADHVSHARRPADVRGHLLAARAALGPPLVPAGARIRRCRLAHAPRGHGGPRPRPRRPSGEAVGGWRRPRRDARRSDPHRRRPLERGRSRPWRPPRRAEIPQRADLPLFLERDVPPPRAGVRRGRARDARGDERGGHLRSSRRRLRALLDRRRMARPAFREDALRQCPNPRTAGAGSFALARSDLRRSRARDGRLADARDAGRRRLRRVPRRRSGRRGGPLLCLAGGRDRRCAWPRLGAFQGGLRRHARGELGRADGAAPHHSARFA